MNFDRNTVIGFVLLAVLFFGFFYYNNQQQAAYQAQKRIQDSTARAQDSIKNRNMVKNNPVPRDSGVAAAPAVDSSNPLGPVGPGTVAQVAVAENDVMRVYFTTRGGQPQRVELKNFKGPDSMPVKLAATDFDRISYRLQTGPKTTEAAEVNFQPAEIRQNADKSTTVTFRSADGQTLVHEFVLRPNNYMIDFNVRINRANELLTNNTLNLTWQNAAVRQQRDLSYERQQSQVAYREDGDYDYSSALSSSSEDFKSPVDWIAVKQQFFNTTLIAKNKFTSGNINWTAPEEADKNIVVKATANMQLRVENGASAVVPMQLFYGPTDYSILKQYNNDMEELVNLGSGIFAFVKWLNRWIILPVFNFLSTLTSNYGIVILLLTLFIRLLISPLTYSSYLSGAKMKVLKPEIEQLKAKYGSDQQAMSMEQMKLFREAGVNPLGGCVPALLQIPIFFALYSFFNSNVALRGQGFLWADDLSQYDSVLNLPFSIPFYGDHVSLFTITAVVTSFLISLYSMSMTPDQSNPVLKYMPYFFPIILLFIFNSLPSGLTWYYTVSNLITLALQFVIQNYIINHDRILAKMEANRKKPKTKSKWQERMEQMQEQQRQLQEARKKTGR